MRFRDREDAAEKLSARISSLLSDEPLVLALPRGGVPIAVRIAQELNAPVDVLIVRKIGAPGNSELGIGAISEGGGHWINREAVRALGVTREQLAETVTRELQEVERRVAAYREGQPLENVKGRVVLIVDDGLATGATARVAIEQVRSMGAEKVLFAAPICSKSSATVLREVADEVICLHEPERLFGVGLWYEDFSQLSDEEVISALRFEKERRNSEAA